MKSSTAICCALGLETAAGRPIVATGVCAAATLLLAKVKSSKSGVETVSPLLAALFGMIAHPSKYQISDSSFVYDPSRLLACRSGIRGGGTYPFRKQYPRVAMVKSAGAPCPASASPRLASCHHSCRVQGRRPRDIDLVPRTQRPSFATARGRVFAPAHRRTSPSALVACRPRSALDNICAWSRSAAGQADAPNRP